MNVYLRSFLIAFITAIFMYVFLIPFLRKIKAGQSIRKEGPKKHYQKAGTPTIGGLVILIAAVVTLLFMKFTEVEYSNHDLLLFLMPLVLYGAIGIIDDYL